MLINDFVECCIRYVSNRDFFQKLVKASRRIKSTRSAIGGNAPVIANRLAIEGARVILGGQDASDLTQAGSLNSRLKSSGPTVPESDIHLIIEYDKGAKFGDLVSPRANRFIVHSDQYNPVLAAHSSFQSLFKQQAADARLLVVGGLQMMEGKFI